MAATVRVDLQEPAGEALSDAAAVVRSGGVIVYPTETIYGIGADALSAVAVERVIQAKQRKDGKPILVITSTMDWVRRLTGEPGGGATKLMHHFWPGPLTLVFPASPLVPQAIAQGTGTVGIRIPSSAFCLRLLNLFGGPLTSTSANISGEQAGRTIVEMQETLVSGIDLFLDAGPLPPSPPSTVVDVTGERPRLLRVGAVSIEALRRIVPDLEV